MRPTLRRVPGSATLGLVPRRDRAPRGMALGHLWRPVLQARWRRRTAPGADFLVYPGVAVYAPTVEGYRRPLAAVRLTYPLDLLLGPLDLLTARFPATKAPWDRPRRLPDGQVGVEFAVAGRGWLICVARYRKPGPPAEAPRAEEPAPSQAR